MGVGPVGEVSRIVPVGTKWVSSVQKPLKATPRDPY